MIINRNLLGDDFLVPEKLCIALFSTGKLKITMKRHATCCAVHDHFGMDLFGANIRCILTNPNPNPNPK